MTAIVAASRVFGFVGTHLCRYDCVNKSADRYLICTIMVTVRSYLWVNQLHTRLRIYFLPQLLATAEEEKTTRGKRTADPFTLYQQLRITIYSLSIILL